MTQSAHPLIRSCRPWLLAAFASVSLLAIPTSDANTVPWAEAPYSQFVKSKSLDRVLTDFAASFSLGISLPNGLDNPVSGRFSAGSPTEFLNRLGRQYGLTWYVHGGVLHVSRVRDNMVRALPVPTVGGRNTVRQVLTDLQVFEPRFGWSELPDQGLAVVTGPRSYVDLIQRTISALPQAPGGQQVVMFRLQHAPVDDRTISYRDREIVVPGVATVLRNLMQMNVPGPVRTAYSSAGSSAGLGSMGASLGGSWGAGGGMGSSSGAVGYSVEASGMGMAAGPNAGPNTGGGMGGGAAGMGGPGSGMGNSSAAGAGTGSGSAQAGGNAATTGSNAMGGPGGPVSFQARPRPSIQSDARLNAIIVQDAPDRIPLYASLIAQMDVPAPLIEIEALIVDVNTSRLEELGIAWGMRGRGGTGAAGYGGVTTTPDGKTLTIVKGDTGTATPTTAVLDTASRYLVAQIRALEQQGDASVQARPSIITSDNIGAVIDLSETVYIQTTSERTALVTPVTAGTTLRVTPRMSRRGEGPAIFLMVDIEDGQVQNASSGGLPSVRKGVVSTEATLSGDESLLIGGYNSEQRVVGKSKIPVLGDLPGLGAFFSNKSDSIQRRERLFLLKARVVQKQVASVNPTTMSGSQVTLPVLESTIKP